MKKFFAIALVLITCCFTMAFFTGCDSDNKYIVITGANGFHCVDDKWDYFEQTKKEDEALKGMYIQIFSSKKDYEEGTAEPVEIRYVDPDDPTETKEVNGKSKEVPKYKYAKQIDLLMAKQNGAHVSNFSLRNRGTRKLAVSFMGGESDYWEYTVI